MTSTHDNRRCIYDPLAELMAHYSSSDAGPIATAKRSGDSVEDRLRARIVDGDRIGLTDDLDEALATHDALHIINSILLDGMKVVGDLFGSGQMQLPFVLQSAETMKAAVTHLEPHMDRSDSMQKGTIVLATVKGDVHDIGKNLVDIILTNNGFRVINLGIKIPVESMLSTAVEQHADAIGMSGLLVKSTLVMKQNLEVMRSRGIDLPVVLGGAALTRRFVEEDLAPLYGGPLRYARDAFDGLRFMEDVADAARYPDHRTHRPPRDVPDADMRASVDAGVESGVSPDIAPDTMPDTAPGPEAAANGAREGGAAMESALHLREVQDRQADARPRISAATGERPPFRARSETRTDVPVPRPPFFGSIVVDDISLDTVFEHINEAALIRGQWQVRRGKRSVEDYEQQLRRDIYPRLDKLKNTVRELDILRPRVLYGYFPCRAEGNDLVILRPAGIDGAALHARWPDERVAEDTYVEWQRFSFPRQGGDRYLCIADYFRPADSGETDVCAFHIVTVGAEASAYTAQLFEQDRYQEYLYMHGLSVESAEALAEYWHRFVRQELGIDGSDAAEIKRLFSQGYQGSRYSFGYPACPNLEDHRQLFAMLGPERIGVELTEEYQLVPEQSTSAIIVHHQQARYFNIK